MKASKPEPKLEELAEDQCREILQRHSFGRIAIVVEGRPQIFPVNYGLREGVVVFRTAAGTKLLYAPRSPVAFEIDDYDPATGVGWSVVVQGEAHDVTSAGDDFSWAARGATVHPVAPGEKTHRVAIDPVTITGRRFRAERSV